MMANRKTTRGGSTPDQGNGAHADWENSVHVFALPKDVTEQELRSLFEERGFQVRRIIMKSRHPNTSSIVSFDNERIVENLLRVHKNRHFAMRSKYVSVERASNNYSLPPRTGYVKLYAQNMESSQDRLTSSRTEATEQRPASPGTSSSASKPQFAWSATMDPHEGFSEIEDKLINTESYGTLPQHSMYAAHSYNSYPIAAPIYPYQPYVLIRQDAHSFQQDNQMYPHGAQWAPHIRQFHVHGWSPVNDNGEPLTTHYIHASRPEEAIRVERNRGPLLETPRPTAPDPTCVPVGVQPPSDVMYPEKDVYCSTYFSAITNSASYGNYFVAQCILPAYIYSHPVTNQLYYVFSSLPSYQPQYYNKPVRFESPLGPGDIPYTLRSAEEADLIYPLPGNSTVDASTIETLSQYENMQIIKPLVESGNLDSYETIDNIASGKKAGNVRPPGNASRSFL
ncbi:uncharacterized protein LOC111262696 isoform X2 [Varroa jacobsoni]|uniref:RRM domain-containing protein n=1 Tax=Varroa destructor TaxID=109461 RepID=A0A7M7J1U5_VARDE|nr:uncharacterized protein LOC111243787 isoform X2 [Varroa destructor]XP_022692876.1 uncharacterized protein LOC111262696 isoform X2 [Varroa jacobsoni]